MYIKTTTDWEEDGNEASSTPREVEERRKRKRLRRRKKAPNKGNAVYITKQVPEQNQLWNCVLIRSKNTTSILSLWMASLDHVTKAKTHGRVLPMFLLLVFFFNFFLSIFVVSFPHARKYLSSPFAQKLKPLSFSFFLLMSPHFLPSCFSYPSSVPPCVPPWPPPPFSRPPVSHPYTPLPVSTLAISPPH